MNWYKSLKGNFRLAEILKEHTTFGIGGRAKFFIEPKDCQDLRLLLSMVKKYKIPIWIIGSGSNILINDRGLGGVVLKLNSPYFKKISFCKNYVTVGAGRLIKELVWGCSKRGLSDLEFLIGIPGTVGGALVMNAGIKGRNIGDFVEKVRVMDYDGQMKSLNKNDIKFEYRQSNLARFIVLDARFKLTRKNKREIKKDITRYLGNRKATQDYTLPSVGCIFKNPPGYSAGKLIDQCGLKGKRIGDACVSEIHCNFIINKGKASAKDVLKLMGLIKRKVKAKFKVNLKPEIKIWQ